MVPGGEAPNVVWGQVGGQGGTPSSGGDLGELRKCQQFDMKRLRAIDVTLKVTITLEITASQSGMTIVRSRSDYRQVIEAVAGKLGR